MTANEIKTELKRLAQEARAWVASIVEREVAGEIDWYEARRLEAKAHAWLFDNQDRWLARVAA